MTFHRNHSQFVRARWRRGLLFPVWAFQAVLLLGILGVFSYRLAETAEHFAENRAAGKVPTVELAWEVTNVALGVLCLVLTIMEAARLLAETLTPFFLLAAHVIKMTCAAAILALDIVVYVNRSEGHWSSVGLALDVALLAAMLALFVYAIVTFRRQRDSYDDVVYPANNAKGYGFGNGYDEIELGGGASSARYSTSGLVGNSAGMGMGGGGASSGVARGDVYLRAGPYNDGPTEYDPGAQGPAAGGESGTRSRSHSAASSLRGGAAGALADDGPRASAALTKDDIDHAISTELWGTALPMSGSSGIVGGSAAAVVERSNSVVATGVVASHHGVVPSTPQRETFTRAASWSVEHGLVSVPESVSEDPGTVRTGGSVATITEEYEGYDGHDGHERAGAQHYGERARDEVDVDEAALAHRQLRTKSASEDRALLMGHSRQGSLDNEEEDDERGPIPDTDAYGHA